MTFSEEQHQELAALLQEQSNKSQEHLDKALSGVMARLVREELPKIVKPTQDRLTEFEGRFQEIGNLQETISSSISTAINSLLEDEEKHQPQQPNQSQGTSSNTTNNAISPEIIDLKKAITDQARTLQEYKQQFETQARVLQQEQEARKRAESIARQKDMDGDVLAAIQGSVRPGTERHLLTLLKSNGHLVEEQDTNRYVIKITDEHGLPTTALPEKVISKIIQEKYPYFIDARPGTGTGATPTSSQNGNYRQQGGKYLQGGGNLPSNDELLSLLNDPNKSLELLRELDNLPA